MQSIFFMFEIFGMKIVNLLPWHVNPYELVAYTSAFNAHNKAYLKKIKIIKYLHN